MIKNEIAFSNKTKGMEAVCDIKAQLESKHPGASPILMIFSAAFDGFLPFSKCISAEYPQTITIGASSYIALSSEGYAENAYSVLAIYDGIECAAGVLLEATRYPLKYAGEVDNAVHMLSDTDNTVCLEFTNAFGNCEELVQDTLRSVLFNYNIPAFGGTAGAPKGIHSTQVSLNGIVYNDAAVFVLIRNLGGRILIYKEDILKPTEHFFIATDVDCDERAVYGYDNLPAAEVVSSALKIPENELPNHFFDSMVGRISGEKLYISAVDQVYPDGRITYHSRIYNRTRLVLLELDETERVWNDTARRIKMDNIKPSFAVCINCLGRSQYFVNAGKIEAFNRKLTSEYGNFVGISGYGEQIDYEQMNFTMILALFE